MKWTLKHVFAGLIFITLAFSFFLSLVFTKDVLYMLCGLSFLFLYLNQLVEIERLEKKVKRYKKAVSDFAKILENNNENEKE